jgi:hypothetical protein
MSIVTFRMRFQDLCLQQRMDVREEVRATLLASGWIEPRQAEEEVWEFEERVRENVDLYLNRNNTLEVNL